MKMTICVLKKFDDMTLDFSHDKLMTSLGPKSFFPCFLQNVEIDVFYLYVKNNDERENF